MKVLCVVISVAFNLLIYRRDRTPLVNKFSHNLNSFAMAKTPPNAPSTTGNKSGSGRGNNPPAKPTSSPKPKGK